MLFSAVDYADIARCSSARRRQT